MILDRSVQGRLALLVVSAAFCGHASLAMGQPHRAGQIQVSSLTFAANRQTVTLRAADPGTDGGEADSTLLTLGIETSYLWSPKFALGLLVAYDHFSVGAPNPQSALDVSLGYYGPLFQVRLPFDTRSEFVLVGSFGGVRNHVRTRDAGATSDESTTAFGRYWLVGGGPSFHLGDRASFDATVRFQSSTFTAPGGQGGAASSAGLLLGLGLSLYFR